MKAISLWQPWASLIAIGAKRYETRSWSTPFRGTLAIHAALRWTQDERQMGMILRERFPELRDKLVYPLPLGAVVCICELVSVSRTDGAQIPPLERAVGDWTPGRYAWQLKVLDVFAEPIPARGAQGLWNWECPGSPAQAQPPTAPQQEVLL